MIKINLIPEEFKEKERKPIEVDFTILISIAFAVVAVVLIVFLIFSKKMEYDNLIKERQQKQKEVEKYQNEVRLIENLKEEQAKLQRRVDLIEQLEKNRLSWAHILDETAYMIYKDDLNLWLYNLRAVNSPASIRFTLQGYTYSNEDLSKYIANLQNSKYFQNVAFNSSIRRTSGIKDVNDFILDVDTDFKKSAPVLLEQNQNAGNSQGGS